MELYVKGSVMKNINDIINLLKNYHLLESLTLSEELYNFNIFTISCNSKDVSKDALFLCKGVNFKSEYLNEAIVSGASVYISERKYNVLIPGIIVRDMRKTLATIAAFFYDYPDRKLKMIGVTGTKGKTTTVVYIKSILDAELKKQGKPEAGLISSLYVYAGETREEAQFTTPEALDFFRYLNDAVKFGLEYMVVEVSSQALKYNRIGDVHFDVACFLNIGIDHISPTEHTDFEDYFLSKLKIFSLADMALYNKDMDYVERVTEEINRVGVESLSFGLSNADYCYKIGKFNDGILPFTVNDKHYEIGILGKYNVANAACALAVADYFNISYESKYNGLLNAHVNGRSELFISHDKRIIGFVDYAHNKMSFENVYVMLKEIFPNYKIVSIFGAPGNRGYNRRKDLPEVAEKYSDLIVFVPEDPRFELFEDIVSEMILNLSGDCPYKVFDDREKAIRAVAAEVEENTVFFIAGKGDEAVMFNGNGKTNPITPDTVVMESVIDEYNKKLKIY